jgi:hypothetical protein
MLVKWSGLDVQLTGKAMKLDDYRLLNTTNINIQHDLCLTASYIEALLNLTWEFWAQPWRYATLSNTIYYFRWARLRSNSWSERQSHWSPRGLECSRNPASVRCNAIINSDALKVAYVARNSVSYIPRTVLGVRSKPRMIRKSMN